MGIIRFFALLEKLPELLFQRRGRIRHLPLHQSNTPLHSYWKCHTDLKRSIPSLVIRGSCFTAETGQTVFAELAAKLIGFNTSSNGSRERPPAEN